MQLTMSGEECSISSEREPGCTHSQTVPPSILKSEEGKPAHKLKTSFSDVFEIIDQDRDRVKIVKDVFQALEDLD